MTNIMTEEKAARAFNYGFFFGQELSAMKDSYPKISYINHLTLLLAVKQSILLAIANGDTDEAIKTGVRRIIKYTFETNKLEVAHD